MSIVPRILPFKSLQIDLQQTNSDQRLPRLPLIPSSLTKENSRARVTAIIGLVCGAVAALLCIAAAVALLNIQSTIALPRINGASRKYRFNSMSRERLIYSFHFAAAGTYPRRSASIQHKYTSIYLDKEARP